MLNVSSRARRAVQVVQTVPAVTETVTVTPAPREAAPVTDRTYEGQRPETWDSETLRAYVARQIQEKHGPFPRDAVKETAIFRSFADRWGELAGPIAQYAFEAGDGRWKGAPVGITRFCKRSDAYFAEPIAARLRAE